MFFVKTSNKLGKGRCTGIWTVGHLWNVMRFAGTV
uniref:Uncharacterized protein n=1 Tax=Anguilla anguilla TaxID=7936 RepID=A0A0E9V359_ANGAN